MKNKRIKILTDIALVAIVILVFSVGFFTGGSVTISGSGDNAVLYSGNENGGSVALMFNVYENTEVVKEIVRVLKENDATATFFVGGCWADDNKETLKLIIESGFELGNHGYFHKDHKKLSYAQNLKEIGDCERIVKSLTGYQLKLFAPPSGSFGKNALRASSELGYRTIMWSKDTIDWRDSDKNLIVKRATNNLKSGDLILMHPKEHTLSALGDILTEIKRCGLKTDTVSGCCSLIPTKV